ncbi:hypothetical protein M8C21_026177 [Ambrosia artemisiifolia]|uniref:BHLH domain-containing protein n=1 Tax=Ambrosia artemisiifolia TaxID=4212 RepID=A0AAD5G767_AMBAR|nr:hypothetical protein M8C21_026177 [Ambrosia artemisiifolia]
MFSTDHQGSDQCDLDLNFKIPNIFLPVSDDSNNVNSFVSDDEHLVDVSDNINPNFYHFFSQEDSISSSDASNGTISISYPNHESFPYCPNIVPPLSNNLCDQPVQFCTNEINNSSPTGQFYFERSLYLTQDVAQEDAQMENLVVPSLKRKLETPELPDAVDDELANEITDKNPKKKIRVSKDNKNKSVQPKKNQKANETEERNKKNNGEMHGQSSSSCSSNDDLNRASNSDCKTRASKGTATDPQSLYARKRREKINERLKILQNLVPNGTKVDISTMLEEAVEYVKFLKLQIQLLSSDDM